MSRRTIRGGDGPLAEQLARILTEARGGKSRRALALELELAPTTLRELEVAARTDGTPSNPTLARVEEVAELYGVRLELVAVPVPAKAPA